MRSARSTSTAARSNDSSALYPPSSLPLRPPAWDVDDRTRPVMTKRQPRTDALDRNARGAFGLSVVSASERGHRLETDRRHRQG